MPDEEKGFVIKDRRRFTPEGEAVDRDDPAQAGVSETDQRRAAAAAEQVQADQTKECQDVPPLPEVNFSTFVFSLSTSALLHLGELPDPNTRERCQNLALAKQTIDILGMLQKKTKGNLDDEEENLLSNLLYELRMKYVSAARKS